MLWLFLFISFAISCSLAAHGIDIATFMGPYSVSQWQCLHSHGIDFAIIEIWRGHHQLADHFPIDYLTAKSVGIYQVDAYAYICNNCPGNTAENICSNILNIVPNGFDGMLWLDVEDCKDCWVGTPRERLTFLEGIAENCEKKGFKIGVYSGHGSWIEVFGSADFASGGLTRYPLWFAHYDNKTSMDDYERLKIGDWKKPVMKQYSSSYSLCGITGLDVNYY